MNNAVIGLGSNIDPKKNIAKAKELLNQNYSVLGESKFIKTKPIGYTQQDDFINGSLLIQTKKNREDVRCQLKDIEKELGREVSNIKFGPRTIDLDIITWNNDIIDDDFYKRDFLKNSVLELIPNLTY